MAWSYEGMSLAEAWRSADDVAEDDERFMRTALEQAKRGSICFLSQSQSTSLRSAPQCGQRPLQSSLRFIICP